MGGFFATEVFPGDAHTFEKSLWPADFGHFFDDDFAAFTVDGDCAAWQFQRLWQPDGERIAAFEDLCFHG